MSRPNTHFVVWPGDTIERCVEKLRMKNTTDLYAAVRCVLETAIRNFGDLESLIEAQPDSTPKAQAFQSMARSEKCDSRIS